MNTFLGKAVLGLALGASGLTAAAPAQAQRYHGGGYHYRGGGAGPAVIAGIAGLAVGAAIASDRPRYYYDGPYGYPAYPAYYGYPGYAYGYPGYYYRGGYAYRGGWHGGYRGGYRGGWHGGGHHR